MKSSTDPDGSQPPLVVLGKVIGVHGLRGTLKVHCFGDDLENLLRATQIFVSPRDTGSEATRYEVADAAPGRACEVRLKLQDVSDRNTADALRGSFVFAARQALQKLAPGEYYWHELIGCRVEDEHGAEIGTVDSLLETGAHDLLVVRESADAVGTVDGRGGKKYLIPTVSEFLREVDVEKRRIVVRVIPGLLDAVE